MIRVGSKDAEDDVKSAGNEGTNGTTDNRRSTRLLRRLLGLVELPLVTAFAALLAAVLVHQCYLQYVTPIVQSYKRGDMEGNFYPEFRHEFTYYNRLCGRDDISTTEASDLLIREDMTGTEAADTMLRHGAVAFRNILRNETAAELREYLDRKNKDTSQLGYNEVFWEGEDGTRIALALGAGDHPVVRDALQQVGNHAVLKRALEGILGPDPAIVEISTLTAKAGCDDQFIHSDSDWFGSSLLYARTFLHSYSFFVALQDTPQSLGATTVCPGSHYCADVDLSQVCMDHGAFSVSTNGHTGAQSVLHQGDAFLFNQNIWHRGPANTHADQDRVMFIMTFVSRTELFKHGDRRRQGLGTYYYQRWNMWGHTFRDLKDAATTLVLRQPLAALRALELYKVPSFSSQQPARHWGIPWIHQLAQQMANGDDFYADYVLDEFKVKVLDWYGIPAWLWSKSEQWERFLPETMQLWVEFLAKVYAVVAAVVLGLLGCWMAVLQSYQREGDFLILRPGLRRILLSHACVGLTAYAIWTFVQQTELAQSVTTGQIFVRPIPPAPAAADRTSTTTARMLEEPTTLPERNDVLIGTRFDADFLASFNRFLDHHPGNQEWLSGVEHAAHLSASADVFQRHAAREIVDDLQQSSGARFLLQDYATGAWKIMSHSKAVEETRRAIVMRTKPLVGHLATHLKHRLADHRFGLARETVWAKRFGPAFVAHWMALLFREDATATDFVMKALEQPPILLTSTPEESFPTETLFRRGKSTVPQVVSRRESTKYIRQPSAIVKGTAKDSARRTGMINDDLYSLQVGELVWVDYEDNDWYQAELVELVEDENGEEMWEVEYVLGGSEQFYLDSIRKYFLFKEGDRVEVDYYGNSEEFFTGTITHVRPDGGCSVLFGDGEFVESVLRPYMALLEEQ